MMFVPLIFVVIVFDAIPCFETCNENSGGIGGDKLGCFTGAFVATATLCGVGMFVCDVFAQPESKDAPRAAQSMD